MQICHNSMFLLQNRIPKNTTHIARKCKNFKNKNNVSLLQLCLQGNMDKSILFFFLILNMPEMHELINIQELFVIDCILLCLSFSYIDSNACT